MRKISKLLAFLTAVAASAVMLTGCGTRKRLGNEYLDLGPIYYKNSTEGDTFLTGLDGNKIKASEIKYVFDKRFKQTNILDEKKFGHADCEGFTYAFKPGVYFDEIRDPEKFDESGYIGEYSEASTEYFRVNVGDRFGSLTVKSAKCDLGASEYNGEDYLGYQSGEIEFDGEITLTGLLNIQTRLGENYGNYEREMIFFAEPENGIPLSLECLYRPEYSSKIFHMPDSRYKVYTDSPQLDIGKLSEYDLDFGGLTYGDTARVEITVTGLRLIGQLAGSGCFAYAELIDIKRL